MKLSTRTLINDNKHKAQIILLTIMTLLSACATSGQKGSFAYTILKKETELIDKIKVERSGADFKTEIEKNESLKRAEVHLMMSLNEIQRANEIVTQKLINQNLTEVKNGN